MRKHIVIVLVALVMVSMIPRGFAGEIIDGVVATVDRKPVLRSDWSEAVRFEAFMHQKRLADVSEAERVAALQRLIDRHLLDAQMNSEKALRPSDDEVAADIAKLREKFPAGSDEEKWQAMIRSYGLTEAIIAAHLKEEVRVMNFIDVQLRPNVRIQDSEVAAYYQTQLLSDLKQNGAQVVPLAKVETKIRELLVQQHMDEMLEAWLHNLRQQSHIQTLVPLPAMNAKLASAGAEGDQ
jgi:SurA-like N-terminal domain